MTIELSRPTTSSATEENLAATADGYSISKLSGPDATAKHTVHRSCASEHSLHVKSKSVNT